MGWNDKTGGPRRGYHHGNLREALITAALRLIAEKGPAGFTIAEAARAAGVSPGAPYRHFRDRDELLADVAARGFQTFEATLRAAWGEGKPDPRAAFERLGRAYLDFARRETATYAAMFESGLAISNHPALHQASDAAFGVLREACEVLVAILPGPRRPPALMVALHIWSVSHGIASLFARGDAARRPLPMPPEDLLDAAVLVYIDGLIAAGRT
jgi:AcrR family transcriptional regulator